MGSAKKQRGKPPVQLRSRTTRSSKGRLLSDPAENNQLLTLQLRTLGLYAAPTIGDGNCLFRALSDQLYGSPSQHTTLRRQICDWIQSHGSRYEPFVEDERGLETHLRCMRENATYGGHMELSAFAHMTKHNVKVIQPGLVYVIEWAAFGDPSSPVIATAPLSTASTTSTSSTTSASSSSSSLSSSSTVYDDDLAGLSERDRRHVRRERIRTKDEEEEAEVEAEIGVADDEDEELTKTVYVAYHDWEHFSSIRNLRGPHTGLPMVREALAQTESPPPSPKLKKPNPVKEKKERDKARKELEKKEKGKHKEEEKKLPKVKLRLSAPNSKSGPNDLAVDCDPTDVPLPDSRSASPFTSSSSTPRSSSASGSSSGFSSLTSLSSTSSTSKATYASGTASPTKPSSLSVPPHLNPHHPNIHFPATSTAHLLHSHSARTNRSPKRSFDESSASGEETGREDGGKRTRTRSALSTSAEGVLPVPRSSLLSGRTKRASEHDHDIIADEDDDDDDDDVLMDLMAVDNAHPDVQVDADVDIDVDVIDEEADPDTPGLSAGGSSSLSSSSSTPSSSASPSPPPPETRHDSPSRHEKPLTRRQRKALGLPKPRAALSYGRGTGSGLGAGVSVSGRKKTGAAAAAAGKIVIPGGRWKGKVQVAVRDGEEGGDDGEWRRNGTGRVDVRGFRELKI